MKKILGISLMAMMAVTAANAEIASKAYVDNEIGNKSGWETAYGEGVDTVSEALAAIKTSAAAGVSGLNYAGNSEAGVVTNVTETAGVITATKAKVTTSEIADSAGIVATQLASDVQTSLGYADNWNTTKGSSAVTESDLTKLHALTATDTELNYVDGVTSSIQDQLDTKQATANMITGTTTSGEGAIDQAATDKYPSMATAKAIADAAAAAAVTNAGVGTQITTAINALDDDSGEYEAGKVVTAVTEADGVITVTQADPLSVTNYTKVAGNTADGEYTLTMKVVSGTPTYQWELITRTGNEQLPQSGE